MAFCVHCGAQVGEGVALCPNCGKPAAQPDAPVGTGAPPAAGYTAVASMPVEENIAGMLAYVTLLPPIIFLLVEPFNRNRFVRFHSFQCIFAWIAIMVMSVALKIFSFILLFIPVLGWMINVLLWSLWWLAIVGFWVLLLIKAWQHEIYKLPVIGDLAERQAGA